MPVPQSPEIHVRVQRSKSRARSSFVGIHMAQPSIAMALYCPTEGGGSTVSEAVKKLAGERLERGSQCWIALWFTAGSAEQICSGAPSSLTRAHDLVIVYADCTHLSWLQTCFNCQIILSTGYAAVHLMPPHIAANRVGSRSIPTWRHPTSSKCRRFRRWNQSAEEELSRTTLLCSIRRQQSSVQRYP